MHKAMKILKMHGKVSYKYYFETRLPQWQRSGLSRARPLLLFHANRNRIYFRIHQREEERAVAFSFFWFISVLLIFLSLFWFI